MNDTITIAEETLADLSSLTRLHTPSHEEGQPEMVVPDFRAWSRTLSASSNHAQEALFGRGRGVGMPPEAQENTAMRETTNTFSPDSALAVTLTARLFKQLTFTHKECYAESLLPGELATGETFLVEMDLPLFLERLFQNFSRPRQT